MVFKDFAATWGKRATAYSRTKAGCRRSESHGEQVSKKGMFLGFWSLPEGFAEGRCPLGRLILSQLSVAWGILEESVSEPPFRYNKLSGRRSLGVGCCSVQPLL